MSSSVAPKAGASLPPSPSGTGGATSSATTCMLLVGDRVVLRASGPPEAEYALFEIGDIELRASEPGRVREHGYQTTVEEARVRLAQLGVTPALARECAVAMQPVLSTAYARGPAARHVARYLGPLELFQSDLYDAAAHVYRGVFVDLPLLVNDLGLQLQQPMGPREAGVNQASNAIQCVYLATLLEGERDDTTVFLSTDAWTKLRKPGERTHRRPNLGAIRGLAPALAELAAAAPQPAVREQLARADVIAFVRARSDAAPDEDARALYASLERAISVREMPDRGPLAEPELWAIETRLDTGNLEGLIEAVEAVERTRGRTPGTTYLRSRASLALRLEPPKLIAERVSALALSMTSFQELCLLAAESWLEAGDPRRAMPYARDLVDAPGVDEGLLLRAQRLLARAVGAAPDQHKTYVDSIPASPMPPSQRPGAQPSSPPMSVPEPGVSKSYPPGKSRVATVRGDGPPLSRPTTNPGLGGPPPLPGRSGAPRAAAGEPKVDSRRPGEHRSVAPKDKTARRGPLPPVSAPPSSSRARSAPPAIPSAPPPPPPLDLDLDLSATHDARADAAGASFTLDLPPTPAPSSVSSIPPPGDGRKSKRPSRRRMAGVAVETRAPPAFDPRAEPDGTETPAQERERAARTSAHARELEARRGARMSSVPPPPRVPDLGDPSARPTPLRPPSPPPMRPPMQTPTLDAGLGPETEEAARTIDEEKGLHRRASAGSMAPATMHGASLPPFRLESPPPTLSKAPLLPKLGGAADELVEHLALPPGLGAEPRSLDRLPKSVLEARIAFTHLARELGLDYRLKRGIELRADVSGIEAMQSVLLETFPDHTVRTSEEGYELRRHGALLSEILARRLDAEWIDISPNELGYWAMIIPPDTRVWPFGRVARLVEMGHKERDLVSYFFELQGRARGR